MNKGIVKFFNHDKGFGFIKVEGSREEIFFHVSNIVEDIFENEAVLFDVQEGKRGRNAVNVKPA
ncbi:MAG TPA: cold shock domain-containing protein [Bacteroidales bacterium]|nr:cold shock domain-containing protein [Bacteroidales bacterium]HSA43027.1 cold shock domain-containing protein [Bacteroidales bacterium]